MVFDKSDSISDAHHKSLPALLTQLEPNYSPYTKTDAPLAISLVDLPEPDVMHCEHILNEGCHNLSSRNSAWIHRGGIYVRF